LISLRHRRRPMDLIVESSKFSELRSEGGIAGNGAGLGFLPREVGPAPGHLQKVKEGTCRPARGARRGGQNGPNGLEMKLLARPAHRGFAERGDPPCIGKGT